MVERMHDLKQLQRMASIRKILEKIINFEILRYQENQNHDRQYEIRGID